MHERANMQIRQVPILPFYDSIVAATYSPNEKVEPFIRFYADEFAGLDFRGIELHGADLVLREGSDAVIDLEGMRCEILNMAPAHSMGDLVLWLPQERVVYCGDIVFGDGGIVAKSEDGMRRWAAALDKIVALDPAVVVPGHGPLCGVDFVKKLRGYFDFVLDEFEKNYEEDLDPLEIAKKLDIEEYINWLQPERLVTIIEALCTGRGKRVWMPSLGDVELFNDSIARMKALREFYEEKYRGILKPWDPMSSWIE